MAGYMSPEEKYARDKALSDAYLQSHGGTYSPSKIDSEYTARGQEYATNPIPMSQYMSPEQRADAAQRYNTANPNWSGYTTSGSPFYRNSSAANQSVNQPVTAQAIPTAPQQKQPFQFNTPAPVIGMRTPNTASDATRRIAKAQSWDAQNNVPMFDNRSIARGGYDQPAIRDMNVVPAETIGGMVSSMVNPKGEQALSGALKAAAARGDWDAVNRYYASQGKSFAGMPAPGSTQQGDLYNRAFGSGIRSVKGRDRAAELYGKLTGYDTEMAKTRMLGDTQERVQGLQNKGYYDATALSNQGKVAQEAAQQEGANRRQLEQQAFDRPYKDSDLRKAQLAEVEAPYKSQLDRLELMMRNPAVANDRKQVASLYAQFAALSLERDKALNLFRASGRAPTQQDMMLEDEKFAEGGLVGGTPPGRAMQPMVNPMGSYGMPSSMQSLDPVIRQYGQYVSAATQYGLQPLPFTKFIDVMASARQQMQQLPTQGGVTPFADGGYVENDSMYADGGLVDNRSWLAKLFGAAPSPPQPSAPSQMAGRGAALLGQGMAGQAGQAIQGRNAALEAALREAQGARLGYADGGAIGEDTPWYKRMFGFGPPSERDILNQEYKTRQAQQQQQQAMPSPQPQPGLLQSMQDRNSRLSDIMKEMKGYANGGAIPVAGRQVLGPGGPTSDSIPAVVDGERPAALSSGEFVLPTDVTKYWGTAKLQSMIDKARGQ